MTLQNWQQEDVIYCHNPYSTPFLCLLLNPDIQYWSTGGERHGDERSLLELAGLGAEGFLPESVLALNGCEGLDLDSRSKGAAWGAECWCRTEQCRGPCGLILTGDGGWSSPPRRRPPALGGNKRGTERERAMHGAVRVGCSFYLGRNQSSPNVTDTSIRSNTCLNS